MTIYPISRNPVVCYSQSLILIASPTVFYSPIEMVARMWLFKWSFFFIFVFKVLSIVNFGLQSFRVSTN